MLEVDQTPIGKTPRSCPATYVGFWDAIRRLFAETTEARMRGYTASRFSFNTAGGRCGMRRPGHEDDRDELPARREGRVRSLRRRALQSPRRSRCAGKGKTIGDVLAMSVDEAVEFFAAHRSIHHALRLLQDVGLGYLTLGPAEPDALRRRSAAHQAGDRAGQGAHAISPARARADAARADARSTCSTSRPSACTWPTSRS